MMKQASAILKARLRCQRCGARVPKDVEAERDGDDLRLAVRVSRGECVWSSDGEIGVLCADCREESE